MIFYHPRDGDLPRDGDCPRDGDHHRYDDHLSSLSLMSRREGQSIPFVAESRFFPGTKHPTSR